MKNPSICSLRRGNTSTPLGLALGVALAHLSGLGVLSASAQDAKLDKIAQENLDLRSRLEMVPCGVGGDKAAGEVFAGVVVDGQQEGLLGVARPPLVDRGVVLPEFAHAGAFPAASGLGHRGQRGDQLGEVPAGVGGDRFAVAVESEAGGQLVRDQRVVGGPLQGQEGPQEALDLQGPARVVVAPRRRAGRKPQAGGAKQAGGGTDARG